VIVTPGASSDPTWVVVTLKSQGCYNDKFNFLVVEVSLIKVAVELLPGSTGVIVTALSICQASGKDKFNYLWVLAWAPVTSTISALGVPLGEIAFTFASIFQGFGNDKFNYLFEDVAVVTVASGSLPGSIGVTETLVLKSHASIGWKINY